MNGIFEPGVITDIALMGDDHYARQRIASLLQIMSSKLRIKAFARDYQVLDIVLEKNRMDLVFISEPEKCNAGFDTLRSIKKNKLDYPHMDICMYSVHNSSLLWVRGDVDAFISLKKPMHN